MTLSAPADAGVLEALRQRLGPLRKLRGPAVADFLTEVRDVVVIASSSRGGSSMVAEMLRESRALLHFTAEINPFLRLAGLTHPDSGTGSDRLGGAEFAALASDTLHMLGEELALDVGCRAERVDDEQFALDTAWRLGVQWPALPLDLLQVARTARDILGRVRADQQWAAGEVPDPRVFFLTLATELAHQGLPVSPWHYDVPKALLHAAGHKPTPGAPGECLVEEPPFVLPRPWCRADAQSVRNKPLVIKTPSNVHRMEFLRALFPSARFRILHLTRNPAAAINGLYDGWLHTGFHAHRMPQPLGIAGYVDQAPDNRWWWKFDLPPGWQEFTCAPLLDVCAFQWRSSHEAVLKYLDRGEVDSITLRFEDLAGGAQGRITAFEQLSDWLGVPLEGGLRRAAYEGIGPVVATAVPSAGRWRTRAALIEPALGPRLLQVADRLGYGDRTSWI